MKPIFKILMSCWFFVGSICAFAQEEQPMNEYKEVRSFRIGAKAGLPNILSGNIEYILPVLNRKFGVSVDYSELKMTSEDLGFETEGDAEIMEQKFNYIEGGLNYYLFKPGKSVYAGLSYSKYGMEGFVPGYTENENEVVGDGYIDASYTSFNLKLGAKWGGLIYFRPEVGYAFNPFPSSIPVRVEFENGTSEDQEMDLTADSGFLNAIFNGLIFNIGLGISF